MSSVTVNVRGQAVRVSVQSYQFGDLSATATVAAAVASIAASVAAAETAETNAEAANTLAQAAKTAAQTAENNAETAEANAETAEANAEAAAAAAAATLADIDDAAAALFYDDVAAGLAGTASGGYFKTFASDRIVTYKDNAGTAVLKSIAPKKADIDELVGRISPFTNSPVGLELERIQELSLTSSDTDALYALPMFIRYFSRIGDTLYLSANKVSDNSVVAGVGLNGSTISVAGLTGIQTLPLLQNSGNGVTGFITIDLRDGSAFNPGPAEWTTSEGGLNNDRIIFANPARKAAIEAVAQDVAETVVAQTGVFIEGATDTYAKTLVRGLKVEGGEGDSYILNYETITYPGIPLTRVQFQLRSVALGATVATWAMSNADEATLLAALPSTLKMSLAANGSILSGYAGVEATLTPDWSVIDLTKAQTAYTTTAATGIHADNIVSNDVMDGFLVRPDPKVMVYVATGETYETVQDAFDAIRNDATPFTRSTYPNSDLCTFSNQYLFQTATNHDEEIIAFTVSSIANGLLLPHYATLHIPEGARLWMDDASSAPVLEANFSCRIRGGGEIEQFGEGYGVHIDALNTLTVKGAADFLRYRHRIVIEDVTIRHHGTTSTAAMIGSGIADGSTMIFRGVRFIREGSGTAPLVIIHTSPSSVVPSTVIFEDCYFNDELITGGVGIQLLKSDAQTVQHKLIVRNTQTGTIQVANSVGGASAWVRQGAIDERITYTSMLDPS